tara:strand:- start:227 stop:499 length:273 start_codon:yes stop_codon:yes gene_type:complete
MFRSKATLPLLATFFFVTTVSLDAVSHMLVHDDHGHEYECPFSNNKVIESDLSDPIKRVEFSPILVAEFSQKYYYSTTNFSFESRAPPKI